MRKNFRGLAQIVLWLLAPGEEASQIVRPTCLFFYTSKWVGAPGLEEWLLISFLYRKFQHPLKILISTHYAHHNHNIFHPSEEHASAHIAVLVEADRRGHYSHGFNRSGMKSDNIKDNRRQCL